MAYVSKQLTDDERKAQEADGRSRPNTSGVLDGYTGMSAPQGSISPSTAKTPGSGFVNLDKYLTANAGEGARMVGDTTKDLATEADGFGDKAAGVVKGTAKSFEDAAGGTQSSGVISGLAKDAAGTRNAASDFLGAGYEGPNAGNLAAGVNADAKALNDRLSVVDNQDMQKVALKDTYGDQGNYTQGFGMLDQFLINGTKSGRDKLAEVKGKTTGVNSAVDSSTAALKAAEARSRADLAANKARVTLSAKSNLDNILARGGKSASDLDRGIDLNTREGYANASLGDGLTDKDRLDLEALVSLTGSANDASWYKKTFNQGTAKPAPVIEAPKVLKKDEGMVGVHDIQPEDKAKLEKQWRDVDPLGANPYAEHYAEVGYNNPPPAPPPPPIPGPAQEILDYAPAPVQEAQAAAANPVGWAKKKWCLANGSMILMADGSLRGISYLNVGDVVAHGGRVTSIDAVLSHDVFEYRGTLVAEGHAVFADGRWTRIGEVGTPVRGTFLVYPVDTEHHLLVTNGTVFADYTEAPGCVSDEECLAALNTEESVARAASIESRLSSPELKRA